MITPRWKIQAAKRLLQIKKHPKEEGFLQLIICHKFTVSEAHVADVADLIKRVRVQADAKIKDLEAKAIALSRCETEGEWKKLNLKGA